MMNKEREVALDNAVKLFSQPSMAMFNQNAVGLLSFAEAFYQFMIKDDAVVAEPTVVTKVPNE